MSKYYCGDKDQLPLGYDGFGTRYQCLRKGYGAALYKQTTSPTSSQQISQGTLNIGSKSECKESKWNLVFWLILIFLFIMFIIFFILITIFLVKSLRKNSLEKYSNPKLPENYLYETEEAEEERRRDYRRRVNLERRRK